MERAAFSGPARWALLALGCLCAAAVVVAVLLVGPKGSSAAAATRTVTAERGVVQSTVTGSGTLDSTQTDVNFGSSGKLTDVLVKSGDKVVEGQKLATIDSTDAGIALEQAQANLRSAHAKRDQAQAGGSNSSASSGSPQGAGAGNSANSAATAASIAAAQADVDSAQASVNSAQRTVDQTTLTAPSSGTVAEVNAGVGDTVSGGGSSSAADSSSGSGSADSGSGGSGSGASSGSGGSGSSSDSGSSGSTSAFIVLVASSKPTLQVPFSESDIGKIKRHQPATVTITALPGTELAAHVTAIATLPTTNSGVTSYEVTFALDQTSTRLRPGMSASAQVVVSRVKNGLNLPSAAISRRGGQPTVTLVKGGKSVEQPVTTGIVGDSTTQIISGLQAGDQVEMSVAGASSPSAGGLGSGRGSGTLGGGGTFGGAGGGPQVVIPGGGGGGFGGGFGARKAGG
jgi:macrolide-specific efflux system membrane fusion protein